MSQTLAPPPVRPDLLQTRQLPSVAGYWIGGITALVGVALVAAVAITGFVRVSDHIDDFPRIGGPGEAVVNLDSGASRTLYVEGVAPIPLTALEVHVVAPAGEEIRVDASALKAQYDVPGSPGIVGYAVGTFHATAPGDYRIEAVPPPGTVLAVGDGFLSMAGAYAAGAFILFVLFVGGGTTLIVLTGIRRSKARRAR